MSTLTQQVRGIERRECEPTESVWFGKANQARNLLNNSLVPLKTWALELGVTERVVQMWASETKEIPPARIDQIFETASHLLIKQREAIDKQIQELLEIAFGGRDPGSF